MELNQLTIPCLDYDASVSFYKALGLNLIVDSPPRYARFECPNGTTLSLHRSDSLPASPGIVIYFEVNDVDATVENLKTQGIAFDADPVDQSWLWREAYLRDPAGNTVCIYHAGKSRRFPPWRVGS